MITDQHLNTGAMALGALPEDEAALFVEHLDTCVECALELATFLETASALGSSVAQTPPASLRRSVMAAVAQTPQLPPLTDPLTGAGTALGRHRQAAEQAAADEAATGNGQPPIGTQRLAEVIPLRRPWYRRPQSLLAAAVAVLVIGGGTTFVLSKQSSNPQTVAECVAAASDRSVIGPTVGKGGDVTLSPKCDGAVVKVPTLPDAPSGKVYQLWVLTGTTATSVGVIKRNTDGSFPAVTAPVHAGDTAVGVTVEPSPGSVKPSAAPFWMVPLTV